MRLQSSHLQLSPLQSSRFQRSLGLTLLIGLGIGLFVLHVFHAIGEGENLQTIVLGVAFPALFALGVAAGGISLWRSDESPQQVLRAGAWALFGTVVFVVAAVLTIFYQQAEGTAMSDPFFMLVNAASGGAIGGFVLGIYDNRQRRARQHAERLSDRLTVLNRVLRHDIRNRANVLTGYAEALADDPANVADKADVIHRQSTEILELGEYAREIEEIFQGSEADREVVDIAALLENSVERFNRDYDIDGTLSAPDGLLVYAHPLIGSAVTAVIENAIEHTDKDTPRISVAARQTQSDGEDYAEVQIADDGPGIPETERVVLERGYETPLEHTSGMGLWLVYWIVSASDGDVELETEDVDGTRVCIRLEVADPDDERTFSHPDLVEQAQPSA